MLVELKIWREGKNILIRNDRFHINTFGTTLEQALKNFHEALLLVTDDLKEFSNEKEDISNLTLVLPYPIEKLNKNTEFA